MPPQVEIYDIARQGFSKTIEIMEILQKMNLEQPEPKVLPSQPRARALWCVNRTGPRRLAHSSAPPPWAATANTRRGRSTFGVSLRHGGSFRSMPLTSRAMACNEPALEFRAFTVLRKASTPDNGWFSRDFLFEQVH